MDNNFRDKRRQESRIFAGLILVGVGAALLLRNSGFPLPYWLFSWPAILILVGLYSGVKHNFRNNTWIILIAVGSFFLVDKFMPEMRLQPYFWPVAIIALGVIFILRPHRSGWLCEKDDEKKNDANAIGNSGWQQAGDGSYSTDSSDSLKMSSVFSGVKRNIVSKNFQGGKISCVFGGADVDLTQADIQGKAEIRFEVVFGGVKLVVPPHWIVYNELDGVFHGVDDKRKFNTATGSPAEKILTLRGSVVFGGVEIRSY
jgi:hypothetical protein